MGQNGVNIVGYFQRQLGLGETARLIASSLEESGVPYCLISADSLARHHSKVDHCPYTFVSNPKYNINLFCLGNDDIAFFIQKHGYSLIKDRYNILLFFWETDVIPQDKIMVVKNFDEVWVMSNYIQKSLSTRVSIPVTLLPLPLKGDIKALSSSKALFGLDDRYMFLFCFDFYGIFQRKNPMALIEAFQKAFPNREDVQLVIKSHNGHHHKNVLNGALNTIKNDSRITWIDESMSSEKRYALINACDCYVSLHRSEGFGLTLAEAMMLEKPVIATGYSGNLEFMNTDNSYLCGYSLEPIGQDMRPYPEKGVWAKVNIEEAAGWMNFVVNNKVEAKKKGQVGKRDLIQNHSLDTVGKKIATRLHEIGLFPTNCQCQKKLYAQALFSIFLYYAKGIVRRTKKVFSGAFNANCKF